MNEVVWSNDGMILKGITELIKKNYYKFWVVNDLISMEQWWNITEKKLKYWEKIYIVWLLDG